MTPRLRKLILAYKTQNPDDQIQVTPTGWLVLAEALGYSSLASNGVEFTDHEFENYLDRVCRTRLRDVKERIANLTAEREELLAALDIQETPPKETP